MAGTRAPGHTGAWQGKRGDAQRSTGPKVYPIRLFNLPRHVLKSDIVEFLQNCNVTENDIRIEYDRSLNYKASWVTFKSEEDRLKALKLERRYLGARRAQMVAGSEEAWARTRSEKAAIHSRGRYLLCLGLPVKTTAEDVKRFFHGFKMMANPVTMLQEMLPASPHHHETREQREGRLRAVARFVSSEEAQRALRTCQNGFVMNDRIKLRVLL